MAQVETKVPVKVLVDLSEIHEARRLVKRVARGAHDADRQLAKLEEALVGLDGRLSEHGIRLALEAK